MIRRYSWVLLAAWSATPICLAQSDEPSEGAEPAAKAPGEGFWLTPRMIELAIDRITEDGVGLYNFNEIQLEQTRAVLKERVPKWLADNRAEIMTLTNQFIEEHLLGGEPPDAEAVGKWAQRVLPLVESFETQMVGATDDMRDFLNEDQIVVLEGEIAAFRTGITFASNKMRIWADGGYDPEIDWHKSSRHREYTRGEGRIARQSAERARENAIAEAQGLPLPYPEGEFAIEPEPPTGAAAAAGAKPTAAPRPAAAPQAKAATDEWEKYTEGFIRKFDLNQDQQSKARTLLKRYQGARDAYLTRETKEFRELEKLFNEIKKAPAAERAKLQEAAEARYQKLHKPVDDQFETFKDKLNDIPTREQHRKAKAAEGGDAAATPASDGAAADVVKDSTGKP